MSLNKKVLVIDDEPDTLELIQLILEDADFEAVLVSSGFEALDILETVKPGLVLLDIMMPDMDGWEVFRKIKEKDSNMPIVILTAKAQNIDKLMGLHVLKADDYITKPFSKDELLNKIRILIR